MNAWPPFTSVASRVPTMTDPTRRVAMILILVAAGAGGCTGVDSGEPAVPDPQQTRPATADACIASPRPDVIRGLPLVDAQTARIAPDVLGEKLTWRAGKREVVAWVGIDAIDVFEDLDFVPQPVAGSGPKVWTTLAYPSLVVAEGPTGHHKPCDRLYVSTQELPPSVAPAVLTSLRVQLQPPPK